MKRILHQQLKAGNHLQKRLDILYLKLYLKIEKHGLKTIPEKQPPITQNSGRK